MSNPTPVSGQSGKNSTGTAVMPDPVINGTTTGIDAGIAKGHESMPKKDGSTNTQQTAGVNKPAQDGSKTDQQNRDGHRSDQQNRDSMNRDGSKTDQQNRDSHKSDQHNHDGANRDETSADQKNRVAMHSDSSKTDAALEKDAHSKTNASSGQKSGSGSSERK
jgi:hypothetical protein